jgi:membrane protein required for colicin V production
MTFVDYTILAIIGILLVLGIVWGFVRVAVILGTWVTACLISINFSSNLSASLLKPLIDSDAVRLGVAMAMLFVITLMLGALVNFLLHQVLGKAGLSGLDRIMGLFLGTALGALIVLVFVLFAGLTTLPKQDWWQSSIVLQRFEMTAVWLRDFMPRDVARYFSY